MSDVIAYFLLFVALGMLGFTALHEARRQQVWSAKNRGLVFFCPVGMLVCLSLGLTHLHQSASLEIFDWVLIVAFFILAGWGLIEELRRAA